MWEKKGADGSIHDMANRYTWNDAFAVHVAGLNTTPCFADNCDWRVPNVKELQSIINYEIAGPSVSSAFNDMCVPGCDGLNCSCTPELLYWTSTTDAFEPTLAWVVNFFPPAAPISADAKSSANVVRAVRGGTP